MLTPPREFDDGFCIEVCGVLVRPMLYEDRRRLMRSLVRQRDIKPIFRTPWVVAGDYDSVEVNEGEIAKQILSYTSEQESADYHKILKGLRLQTEHPDHVQLGCDTCKTVLTDIDTGKIFYPQGSTEPQARPAWIPVPCDAGKVCPKGHWSQPSPFDKMTQQVWKHYWWMKAARRPAPDCPIIMRNWAAIEWVVERGRSGRTNPMAFGPSGRPTGLRDT